MDKIAQHLELHLESLPQELNDDEKWLVATHRTGTVKQLDREFAKVNPDFAAGRNWVMLLWGAVFFLILQSLFVLAPALWLKMTGHSSLVRSNTIVIVMGLLLLCLLVLVILFSTGNIRLAKKISYILEHYPLFLIIVFSILSLPVLFGSTIAIARTLNSSYSSWLILITGVLYISVLQLTMMETLRYTNKEYRTRYEFFRNMNWRSTMIIGLFPAMMWLTFGFALGNLISPLVFAWLGWIVSFSKKPATNLFCIQFFYMVMISWVAISMIKDAHIPFLFQLQKSLMSSYLITISIMLISFFAGRFVNSKKTSLI